MATSTLEQKTTRVHETDEAKEEVSPDVQRRFESITAKYERYLRRTFNELGAASARQTEELRKYLRGLSASKESVKDLEAMWDGFYVKLLESAEKLFHQEFMDKLVEASTRKPRAISATSIQEWGRRFRDQRVDYKDREKFIRETLPEWIHNWERVADQRDRCIKHRNFASLTEKECPGLSTFRDEEKFLNLHYPERQKLADQIESKLEGVNVGELFAEAKKRLKSLEGKVIQSADRWLHRIFTEWKMSPAQIKKFLDGDLHTLINDWKDVRKDFDDANAELLKAKPTNFRILSPTEFLALHFTKRQQYVEDAHKALEKKEGVPDSMMQTINRLMRDKDWETAIELIEDCEMHVPGDVSLQMHKAFAKEQLAKVPKKAEKSPGELKREIWDLMEQTPEPLRTLNEEACLMQDPDVLERLMQNQFNWAWLRGRGYADREMEQREAKSDVNKARTEDYMEEGHTRLYEKNVIVSDTAEASAIRGDQCSKPQLVFLDATDLAARQAYLRRVREHKTEKNSGFGYWSTLIPMDSKRDVIDFGLQSHTVFSVNYKLKKAFRSYLESGERYEPRTQKYAASGGSQPWETAAKPQLTQAA